VGRYRDLYEKSGRRVKICGATVIWELEPRRTPCGNWRRALLPGCTNFGADYPEDLIYKDW